MSDDKNVLDFTTIKVTRDATRDLEQVTRDATRDLEQVMRRSIREGVEQIAIMHGGMPDEWIEAKAAACIDILTGLIDAARMPVRLNLPKSLDEKTVADIEAAVAAWALQHNEECQLAFARRVIQLLGPP